MKQAHRKNAPCPLCDGYDTMPRGKGIRCSGFTDGNFTHCSRDELAGSLTLEGGGTYCHRMEGSCRCGIEHNDRPAPISIRPTLQRPATRFRADDWTFETAYNYTSAGVLTFQKCRSGHGDTKLIRQRQPDPAGGWWADLQGVETFLYRRDELPTESGAIVVLANGEKAVDRARQAGIPATCSPYGEQWRDPLSDDLRGLVVILVRDPDATGERYAQAVTTALSGIAQAVYVINFAELGEKADLFDFLESGGTTLELYTRALAAHGCASEPATTTTQANIERDLEQAQEELKGANREAERLRKRCALQGDVITTLDHLFSSPSTKQEVKAPFAQLVIHRFLDPRFADADTQLTPIWQEQFSEMMGGADPKTVRTWLQTIGAENLGTVVKEKTGKMITLPTGGRKPQERYAIQFGPDPDREPVTLATWRELMCNPKADARRQPRKAYERRCSEHPDALLRRDYRCSRCEKLVDSDFVAPSAGAPELRHGKVSPPVLSLIGKISPAAIVDVPPQLPATPCATRETFPCRKATCNCGGELGPGDACHRCNMSACRECGELVQGTLSRWCRAGCRHPRVNVTDVDIPEAQRELAAEYSFAAIAGGA